jgi:glycosyltransferase involved in cell wall biosynthesis
VNRLRILALSPVPYEGAGCRFRISQYLPYLATQGIDVTVAPFYDREFFRLVYEPGRHARKALLFLEQTAARVMAIARADRYDAIWIYREALPIGPPILESVLSLCRRPLLYDFDDAVFLPNTSEANRYLAALKFPGKTGWIIRRAAQVIAGNEYLASYARGLNPSVHVIPTAVDTDVFVPRSGVPAVGAPLVIGWIGTPTTAPYLMPLGATLAALAKRHAFTFRISGGGADLAFPGVDIEHPQWSLEGEVALFNGCDIGVYPMPDDDWARGKSGFKAIQFMACGVPVVASPVGINVEIIQDGVNGFLASTPAEWEHTLGTLIADPELRHRMGAAGRRTVEARYSIQVNAPRVAAVLRQTAAGMAAAAPLAHAPREQKP